MELLSDVQRGRCEETIRSADLAILSASLRASVSSFSSVGSRSMKEWKLPSPTWPIMGAGRTAGREGGRDGVRVGR